MIETKSRLFRRMDCVILLFQSSLKDYSDVLAMAKIIAGKMRHVLPENIVAPFYFAGAVLVDNGGPVG